MGSSDSSNLPVDEEEADRLRRQRVSLKRSADLLGRSYPSVRRLRDDKKLITFKLGGQWMVNLTEIKRFLVHGNATESDWNNHERSKEND